MSINMYLFFSAPAQADIMDTSRLAYHISCITLDISHSIAGLRVMLEKQTMMPQLLGVCMLAVPDRVELDMRS